MPRSRVAAAALLLGLALGTQAQDFALDIPPQDLQSALVEMAATTGVQLLYSSDVTRGLESRMLRGRYTPETALARLLEDTGLSFRYTAPDTITIERVHEEQGLRSLGPVCVGATQRIAAKGANGSTDLLATENSGSYAALGAALGGPVAQELRRIPRAVSVVGQTQIRDLAIVDVVDAIRLLPGVTSVDLSGHEILPVVRGHAVTHYQYDGGAVSNDEFGIVRIQGDLSAYDRVELLRGGDGFGNGFSSPGGIFNFVRKRPLNHRQLIVETQAGSWDDYRGMVDVTAPLGWDGRLRGRAVAFGTDQRSFRDREELQRQAYYGVIEADLGSSTLLALGTQYSRQEATPFAGISVPAFSSGAQIGLPRSTSFLLPWHGAVDYRRNTYMTLDQALGPDWSAGLVLGRENNDQTSLASFVEGRVDPQTGQGVDLVNAILAYQRQNTTADLKVRRRFSLSGLEQQLILSFSSLRVRGHDYAALGDPGRTPLDVFDFDPADHPRPAIPPDEFPDRDFRLRLYNGSVALTLSPWEPLQLTGAWRWDVLEVPGFSAGNRHYDAPSYLGLSYAVDARWSLYASWADVYENQGSRTAKGGRVDPVISSSYETGLKFTSTDGGLNGLLALYRIEQRDFVRQVSGEPFADCCYDNGSNERRISEGLDAELSGALRPGWQLIASYNYGRNRLSGSDSADPGERFDSTTPRHLFKLWSVWQPRSETWQRLRLGGGLRAQSRASYSDIDISETENLERSQGSYAVADALVGWHFDSRWNASLHVRNIFDRTYYTTFDPNNLSANLYGEPRSLLLTLRATY
ncbi:MAG: TonB-dependent siderophore receptor [Panacagrimonas sp.]